MKRMTASVGTGIIRTSFIFASLLLFCSLWSDNRMKRKASPTVTAEMAGHIKYLWHVMGLYQHQIAALLGINQGRVSEVVNGKRHPGVGPIQGSFSF
jgi:hypothetical protein